MIFTSYTYVVFLIGAFLIHWLLPSSWRKPLLVAASYFFYCTWRWEFGLLLLAVSLLNWAYGRWLLARFPTLGCLVPGILVNLAPLVYFKYTLFLAANAASVVNLLGGSWHPVLEKIVLPLGISFFTFQNIAYLIDVAAGERPLGSLLDFLLFEALWPKLISGPIIRASDVRQQLEGPRVLDYTDFSEGCRRIVLGFSKKVLLADNLAPVVEMVFGFPSTPNALDCVTATLAFGLQIYFDFAAYSDIAIGSARLFGFRLPENFNWPYVSRSPQEFWNRWHITLSRWIRDYLFTPMSFASRRRPGLVPLWLLLSMAICGLWHDAAWTFVLWGAWHGLLLVLNQTLLKRFFPAADRRGKRIGLVRGLAAMTVTFLLVQVGWLLFRASSLEQAWNMLHSIAVFRGGLRPSLLRENAVLLVAAGLAGLCAAQLLQSHQPRLQRLAWSLSPLVRVGKPLVFAGLILAIIIFDQEATTFVYFQF